MRVQQLYRKIKKKIHKEKNLYTCRNAKREFKWERLFWTVRFSILDRFGRLPSSFRWRNFYLQTVERPENGISIWLALFWDN